MHRFSTPYCGTACNGKVFKDQRGIRSKYFQTYIAIFIAHINDPIVYVGRGTAGQQESDNHKRSFLMIAHRQRGSFGRVQIRAHSGGHRGLYNISERKY